MKIAFVTSTLTSGGSERVMSLLANQLAERGHEVEIINLNKHIVFYPIHEKVMLSFAEDEIGSSILKKILWLRKHVKVEKPDVVVPFMEAVYCLTLLALIGLKVPVISSERIDPRYSPHFRNILRRIFLPLTTHLVVQTEDIKAFYPKFIQKKTSIIYNPISETVFHLQEEPKQDVIINVGKLDEQKNQQLLIKAFAKVADEFPEWKLVIYGEGPERAKLEKLIASLNENESHLNTKVTEELMVNGDRLMVNDDRLMVNRDRLMVNRDRLMVNRDRLMVNRDRLMVNGDRLMVNDDRLMVNDDRLMVNGDRLMVNGDRLMVNDEGLKTKDERLKISSRILLPGRSEKVIEEMNRAKVFAFSSDYEGMSNAIMEAVCVGLPIVTTNVSGAAELVKDGEGGFVVPIRDEKKLAETLRKLLSDEKLRAKMAKHNKATAPQFKQGRIVDQWENLLSRYLKQK